MDKITNTQRSVVKALLADHGLIGLFAFVTGDAERGNSAVKKAMKDLGGFGGFTAVALDVLQTQVSGQRGRPALEEQPVHAIIKALRVATKSFTDTGNADRATKEISKGLKVAQKAQTTLERRRALYKPSKRIQGTKGLIDGLLPKVEPAAKAS